MAEIRTRMQAALDDLNRGIAGKGQLREYPNPFPNSATRVIRKARACLFASQHL